MAVKMVQAIIKGITYTLSLNSSTGMYEATATAPAETSYNNNPGHYFPITIRAEDDAGNATVVSDTHATFGEFLKLRVKEVVAPAIIITNPTESEITSNNKPTVNWTVTDSGSGVDPNTIGITIDEGTKITAGITKTAITNGYQCSYTVGTALLDGMHTVYVNADDFDGNSATQRAVNFVVDTVPPELSVTAPVNNLVTNNANISVVGITRDLTSGPCKVTIRLNGGAFQDVSVDNSGNFSKDFTMREGANTIVVTSTDAGGISSSITRIVTLDTAAPVISEVQISPNPVSTGEILTLSAKVTD